MLEVVEYFQGVVLWFDAVETVENFPVRSDDVSGACYAHEFSAVHAFFLPDSVFVADGWRLFVDGIPGVGEDGEVEIELIDELAVRFDFVG